MIRDALNLPTARTWRDIPQPAVPRAMSREGRWRLAMSTLRVVAAVVVCLAIAWAAWLVAVSVRENTRAMPAAAKATPMKQPVLRTDGVLDDAWLARTLALPANASLMELDLQKLQARLLAEPQIASATLTKNFPDRLIVQVSERSPVARLMMRWLGQEKALLVARDGVIYAGENYDASVINTLPWLDGVKITPDGGGFRPIEGMAAAAELLGKARLEAEHLYSTWSIVSLARLTKDHKIEVRTKDGLTVAYFSTNDDFFRQLAKLDYIVDTVAARTPGAKSTIDLSLGQDVPVMLIPAEPPGGAPAAAPTPLAAHARVDPAPALRFTPQIEARSERALFVLPHSQPKKIKREL